ncbi:recombination mediator RecR [bacterium]|nr:recombination mediator RecR [bacterium]
MKFPKPVGKLIESFERLPGIGPKTAQRLTFYLLHFPEHELQVFADALVGLKKGTMLCSICKNVSEDDLCNVCSDSRRDANKILVVTSPLDAFALERTGYDGHYHVLHGVIDPLNNIGPEEIFIGELLERLDNFDFSEPIEVILATSSNMEGESTAMYIAKVVRDRGLGDEKVRITRIARGLPVGGDVEYADSVTLQRALEGRRDF